MGTWALPNTKQKAEKLQELFREPIYSNQETKDALYDLYGDDELFDDIDGAEYKEDIRYLIACYLDKMIKYYNEKPECFNVQFDKNAIKILKAIVTTQGI